MPRLPHLVASLVVLALAACEPEASRPAAATRPQATAAGVPDAATEDTRPVVVFLGTSLTAGLGLLRPEDTFVARVAEMADSAGRPIRAVNAGVSGETSAGGLRRLDWVLREPLDVLVVELGANDGLRGQDPTALEANLDAIIDRTRARYPEATVVVVGMQAPPNLGEAYGEAFRGVFPRVAREHDAHLVPFLLEGVAGVPELNQSDGIHPTARGHRIIAGHVWSILEDVLAQRPSAVAVESAAGG